MKLKIEKLFLRILFGKSALNGYYVPPKDKVSKNYIDENRIRRKN